MDTLAAEIAGLKRKTIEDPSSSSSDSRRANKYVKKGDLERMERAKREEEENKAKETKRLKDLDKQSREPKAKSLLAFPPKQRKAPSPSPNPTSDDGSGSPAPGSPSTSAIISSIVSSSKPEAFNIPPIECIRRLRSKAQPVRLFGESDRDRRLRLRALELMEERGGKGANAGLNDFKKALEEMEMGMAEKDEVRKTKAGGEEGKTGGSGGEGLGMGMGEGGVLDLNLIKTDPDKLYPLIYYALKRTLKDWEQTMNERPDSIKRSTQGMRAAAVQVQSADYLKPLFKSLRSRALPADVLGRLSEIVHHMQSRQYQRANDSYLRLSIGTAAWPIGVTMVGIHERSAREKISSDSVAHVLNDEVSRKYIQSVKRLLTFAQTKYPPQDVSQLMG